MWNENKVTEILHIKYPIIQAGMAGGITTPELVATVSNAGCLGSIGAGYMTPKQLRENIKAVKQLTNKPFAVNLFVPEEPVVDSEEIDQANEWLQPFRDKLGLEDIPKIGYSNADNFAEQIQVIIDEAVPICSFTFGIPSKALMRPLKEAGIIVIGTATSVKEAKMNEDAGMELVVMQGSEAGGHRGTFAGTFKESMVGTMALVPQAVDQIKIPVIAAGGIADGRGILSALLLGAQAVQLGTAFVASLESGAKDQYKETITASTEVDSVITAAFSGKPARGIRNDFITKMENHEKELPSYPVQHTLTKSIRNEAAKQNRSEWMSLWCGQNPGLVKLQSADQLIIQIISQIEAIIKNKVKSW